MSASVYDGCVFFLRLPAKGERSSHTSLASEYRKRGITLFREHTYRHTDRQNHLTYDQTKTDQKFLRSVFMTTLEATSASIVKNNNSAFFFSFSINQEF